jgi:hypothetical protein
VNRAAAEWDPIEVAEAVAAMYVDFVDAIDQPCKKDLLVEGRDEAKLAIAAAQTVQARLPNQFRIHRPAVVQTGAGATTTTTTAVVSVHKSTPWVDAR